MKEEIKESLESFGLSEKEMNVYISLLELGDSPVNRITEKSELLRVTIYPILKSLIEKGFVSRYSMDRKSFFKAINPEQITDKIKEIENKVKIAIPSLKELMNKNREKTEIELFRGKKGVSSFFEKIYSGEDKELWAYGNGKAIDEIIKYQSLHARKLRINKKIKLNIKVNPTDKEYFVDKAYKKITSISFNKKLEQMEIYIIFGKKKAGMIDLKQDITAILIENEEIARYHGFVFDML